MGGYCQGRATAPHSGWSQGSGTPTVAFRRTHGRWPAGCVTLAHVAIRHGSQPLAHVAWTQPVGKKRGVNPECRVRESHRAKTDKESFMKVQLIAACLLATLATGALAESPPPA